MRVTIRGGRVIDPENGRDALMDIVVEEGTILRIEKWMQPPPLAGLAQEGHNQGEHVHIDATGMLVVPGLIDMHVHLREPGEEYKETIASGTLAAAWGGFTSVCCMANTCPVNDNRAVTAFILQRAAEAANARVYPIAAITPGLEGKGLCEYLELKAAGAVAVSDDGRPVTDAGLMRRAMEYAHGAAMPVICHCEEPSLSCGGVMNEGPVATRLGLGGIPNAAESIMVEREISLCALTGAQVHIAHVSTAESVRALRRAKACGITVTAETAPHYFTLTDEAVRAYDTNAKMNPPLRSERDRQAIMEGLADGTIDVIATDHAPHSVLQKDVEFDHAANGIVGLETSLALSLSLVRKGVLSMGQLVEKMHTNPARILRLQMENRGLREGGVADVTIIDPEADYVVDAGRFASKGRNTPFNGWTLRGKAAFTIVGGRIVFDARCPRKP